MSAPVTGLPLRQRSEGCPSDLALDRLRADELDGGRAAELRAHLETCATCGARLRTLAQEDARFGSEVWVSGEAQRAKRALRRPQGLPQWLPRGLIGAAAAAAAVLIFAHPWAPHAKPNQTKGGDALALIVRHPDGRTEDVLPGQGLSPGDAIRMVVTPRQAGAHLIVLDLDSRGSVSAFTPTHGEPKLLRAGRQLIEGSIALDDSLGPERLVALFCDGAIPVAQAVEAGKKALAQAGGDPRALGPLGLPCHEAPFLIQKEPKP